MIVVFDTNVWLSHLGLRSPAASGVRFFLKHNNFKIALPEVIRMEVEVNLRSDLMKFINNVRNSHEQLLTVFQELPKVDLPNENDVEKLIPLLFTSMGVKVIKIPFSLKSARSSFLKTINKEQPSHVNQQFKDGVIWADCLNLLETDDVTLVTNDKAFYAGGDVNSDLASNLRKEAAARPHFLRLVNSLPKLLEKVSKDIPFNEQKLIEAALVAADSNIIHYLGGGFRCDRPYSITRSLFATEDPGKLFFECVLAMHCYDVTESNRTDALLTIIVDGIYAWEKQRFDNVEMVETKFTYVDEFGQKFENSGVWLRTAGIGRGMAKSLIRERVAET